MNAEAKKVRHEHSSGGAVVSFYEGSGWVAMIATRNRTRWGLPKGAIGKHETSERAAVREVLEETGLRARILHSLDTIEYVFRAGDTLVRKSVDFYFMQFEGGRMRPQLSEVDDVEWVELEQSLQRASFDSERKILEKVVAFWGGLNAEERGKFSR